MNMKIKLFTFFFLLIVSADAQQLIFPEIAADRITGMWFLKDKEELIMINAAGSIYKSYDGGTTWEFKKNFPDVELTEIIFTDNVNGFISPSGLTSGSYTGLIYTTDGGETWKSFPVEVQNVPAFLPLSQSLMLRSDWDGHILKLDNFLNKWDTLYTMPHFTVYDPEFGPQSVPYGYIAKLHKLPSGDLLAVCWNDRAFQEGIIDYMNTLLKSTDGGQHWFTLWNGYDYLASDVIFTDDSTGWMYSYYDLFKSMDGGKTWDSIQTGYAGISDIFPLNEILYISVRDGIVTWPGSALHLIPGDYLTELLFIDEHIGFVFGEVFYRFNATSNTFDKLIHKIHDNIHDLDFVNKSTGYAVGDHSLYKTTDGGHWWKKILDSGEGYAGTVEMLNDSTGWFVSYNKVLKTTDAGAEWSEFPLSDKNVLVRGIAFYDDNTGLINTVSKQTSPGNYKAAYHLLTTDAGKTWSQRNISSEKEAYFDKVQFTDQGTVWGINGYGLWKSTDTARTWSKSFGYDYFTGGYSFHFYDKSFGVIALTVGIMITTDGGENWKWIEKRFYANPKDVQIIGPDGWGQLRVIETGEQGRIMRYHFDKSGNLLYAGRSFSNTALRLNAIDAVVEKNMVNIWLGGDGFNVFSWDEGILTDVVNDVDESVYRYELYKNYPNPFNPETVISYELARGGKVELRIYDILGNEVTVLKNEYQSHGRHEVRWNASGLPSGIYIYRIKADEFSSSGKMILMK